MATDAEAAHGGTFDALVTTLPGQQADQLVRMLLLEHIPSAIECDGVRKVYTEPPAQPYAVTLPVTVFVHAEDLEAAREIAASLESDDLIGDQWSDGAPSEEHEEPFSPDMTALDSDEPPPAPIEEPAPPPVAAAPLQPERSPLITLIIIAALALALYVAFLR